MASSCTAVPESLTHQAPRQNLQCLNLVDNDIIIVAHDNSDKRCSRITPPHWSPAPPPLENHVPCQQRGMCRDLCIFDAAWGGVELWKRLPDLLRESWISDNRGRATSFTLSLYTRSIHTYTLIHEGSGPRLSLPLSISQGKIQFSLRHGLVHKLIFFHSSQAPLPPSPSLSLHPTLLSFSLSQ